MRKYDPTYYFSHSDKCVVTEESLLREPELWMPGRKPTGPVRIDWSHPLTEGLHLCFLPSAEMAGAVELVNSLPIIYGLQWGTAQYWSIGAGGKCLHNADSANTSTKCTLLDNYGVPVGPHSFYCGYDLFSESTSRWIFSFAGIQNDAFGFRSVFTNGTAAYYRNSGVADVLTFTLPESIATIGNSVVYTSANDGDGYLYTNKYGRLTGTTNADATRDNALTNTDFVFQNTQAGQSSSSNSNFYSAFFWNKELSDSEAWSIVYDPYQFLVPA